MSSQKFVQLGGLIFSYLGEIDSIGDEIMDQRAVFLSLVI